MFPFPCLFTKGVTWASLFYLETWDNSPSFKELLSGFWVIMVHGSHTHSSKKETYQGFLTNHMCLCDASG